MYLVYADKDGMYTTMKNGIGLGRSGDMIIELLPRN